MTVGACSRPKLRLSRFPLKWRFLVSLGAMDHPLTEAFRKARKQYTLFSGLLIAWELVGLRLPADGKLSTTIEVELLSPNAAPFVLIALILYFAFRMELEWRYCSPEEHHQKIARLDYWSTHGIALAAVGLFGVQRLLEVQVAETVAQGSNGVVMGFSVGLFVVPLLASIISRNQTTPQFRRWWNVVALVTMLFSTTSLVYILNQNDWRLIVDREFFSGLALILLLACGLMLEPWIRSRDKRPE